MDGIERALHVYHWCVPSPGKQSDRNIDAYAERIGLSKQAASQLSLAGKFESATNLSSQLDRFDKSYTLWYELSKADERCWPALRAAVERASCKRIVIFRT